MTIKEDVQHIDNNPDFVEWVKANRGYFITITDWERIARYHSQTVVTTSTLRSYASCEREIFLYNIERMECRTMFFTPKDVSHQLIVTNYPRTVCRSIPVFDDNGKITSYYLSHISSPNEFLLLLKCSDKAKYSLERICGVE